jgi:hypothetical protein
MPKMSFASADFYEPKLGFTEGTARIEKARTIVFQYPPNRESGEQFPEFLAALLKLQRVDEQLKPTDDEPMEKILRIEKDLTRMRPGQAASREDADPSDLGPELGTEGNTVFGGDGVQINNHSAFATFLHSLEEHGFKPDILKDAYLPDLEGTIFHGITQKGAKTNIGGREVEPNYLVVDKIMVFPYEKAAKKPAGKATTSTSTAKPATTAAPAAATTAAAAAASNGNDPTAIAQGILSALTKELAGETRDSKKFASMAYSRLVRDKSRDKKYDKAVQDLFRSDEFLIEQGAELGFDYDGDTFTFSKSDEDAAA